MLGTRRTSRLQMAAIEVSREHLTLGLLDTKDGKPHLRWKRAAWSHDAGNAFATIDQAALAATLREMVGDDKIAAAPLQLVLSGDFCVTRTVAGTRDQVEQELKNLRDRSALYISLGHGSKSFAESVRTIDARRTQGSITVTNEQSLAAVSNAVRELGFKVKSIEHSLVALSRAVGKTGRDAESPVILVELHQRGIDLGITFQGRLLLDYRPGGLSRLPGEQRQLADIILKHLGRIRRYCHRYFQFSGGKISQVLLCGEGEEIEVLRRHLESATDLQATVLMPQEVCPDWLIEGGADDGWLLASLGALLKAGQPTPEENTPDLLTPLLLAQREPLWPALAKHAWMVAAALALTITGYAAGLYQHWHSSSMSAAVAKARDNAELLAARQIELASIDAKMRHLTTIGHRLTPPTWDDFLAEVSSCLPQGAWLESLKVNSGGTVYLFGPSFNEDGVYDFVEHLKAVASLSDVVLEGTKPARLETGPATLFDVKCTYSGRTEHSEGS